MCTGIMQCIYTFLGGGCNYRIEVSDTKYDEIVVKISDFIIFDNEDITYLNTLPNNKLIDIIKIYNNNYTEIIHEIKS